MKISLIGFVLLLLTTNASFGASITMFVLGDHSIPIDTTGTLDLVQIDLGPSMVEIVLTINTANNGTYISSLKYPITQTTLATQVYSLLMQVQNNKLTKVRLEGSVIPGGGGGCSVSPDGKNVLFDMSNTNNLIQISTTSSPQ